MGVKNFNTLKKMRANTKILVWGSIILIGFLFSIFFLLSTTNKPFEATRETKIEIAGNREISELKEIELGDIHQWISIEGKDASNPILLVLHGGPGFAMLPLLHDHNSEIEDHLTVVNWDQRGAGRSYSKDIPKNSMTLNQFVSDAHELTGYLKKRFGKEKISIMGHSWGTIVGMELVQAYPEDYSAFIGVGQVVDVIENEQQSYDFALKQAIEDDNTQAILELREIGRPDNYGAYHDESGYDITMKWVGYYGGDLYGKKSTVEIETYLLHHDVYDGYELEAGWDYSEILFEDSNVLHFDARESIPEVEVPIYFFAGRHDYDTPSKLVENYYSTLRAPVKELIWFENSAHFPFYSEPDKFSKMIIEKLAR